MIRFLSYSETIELYDNVIAKFGGLKGIRDKKLLESALAYPKLQHSIGQEKDIFALAASYAFHIINNHPFTDGNKRIGILAMLTFLRINNIHYRCSHNDLYDLAIKIASSQIAEDEIATTLKEIQALKAN